MQIGNYKITLIILTILHCSFQTKAQQHLNLDFEKLSVEGVSRPWGWSVYSYDPSATFRCDSSTVFAGDYSLMIQREEIKSKGRFELSFFVEPNQILGKQIRVDGWAKSKDLKGITGIQIQSIGEVGGTYGTLQQSEVLVNHSSAWQHYSTGIHIGNEPHSIIITLFSEGEGTVWFDHLQMWVNDTLVQEVPVAQPFSKSQLDLIANEVKEFETVEPHTEAMLTDNEFKDLKYFRSMVGDARIIALGESTHGTSEFFKVKHRLLQYAIFNLGVRVFVLEDNQLLVERINDFVLHGIGEARKVIQGLFAVWNTQEMLELIQWVRMYNLAHPTDKVEFVGMDVQNPSLALDHLDHFLSQKDTLLQARSAGLLKDIKLGWRNSYFESDSVLKEWDQNAALNFNLMAAQKEIWMKDAVTPSERSDIAWSIQNARVIKQFVETALGGVYEGRDRAMAENITWILDQREADTKIVVWAHDSHVSRGDAIIDSDNFFLGKSMGSYLSEKYKEAYRAFGLFTYQGTCLGTVSYSDFTQIPFDIYTSPVGSLDEALHQISVIRRRPNLMMNLRPFKKDLPKLTWITDKRPVRYVGYVAEDYGFGGRYSIPYQFDGILFIDHSSAAVKPK